MSGTPGIPETMHQQASPVLDSAATANAVDKDAATEDVWHTEPELVPTPLVPGISNEDIWMLVRRTNKQIHHVKALDNPPPGKLDLNISDAEEFSPEKMRSNVERAYMTILIGMVSFLKHVIRLRSWNEKRRTQAFCAAYFVAWALNLVMPLLMGTLIALIAHPPARTYLFPPVRLSKNANDINSQTKTLDGGTIGAGKGGSSNVVEEVSAKNASDDSATGAPEGQRGEAVEQEARHFVSNFVALIVGSATGRTGLGVSNVQKDRNPISDSGVVSEDTGGTDNPLSAAVHAQDVAKSKVIANDEGDKTKQPLEAAMWEQLRPVMHLLGDVCDTWERFANALSPTPPFHRTTTQYRLAAIIVPGFLLSLLIPPALLIRGTYLILGAAFFGQPVIDRGLNFLNMFYPDWKKYLKYLQLRNNILIGVPTNAQLTLTLLRLAEANNQPLPPPPQVDTTAPNLSVIPELSSTSKDINEDDDSDTDDDDSTTTPERQSKRKRAGLKVAGLLKKTAKAGVGAVVGIDRVRATAGSEPAKNRIGALPATSSDEGDIEGPTRFAARWKGKKGWVTVSTKGTTPCVAFCREKTGILSGLSSSHSDLPSEAASKMEPVWTIALADIQELKKVGGFGWKGQILIEWALGMEVADGIEIIAKRRDGEELGMDGSVVKGGDDDRFDAIRDDKEIWVLTAVAQREELFNRLLAIGGHKWEAL